MVLTPLPGCACLPISQVVTIAGSTVLMNGVTLAEGWTTSLSGAISVLTSGAQHVEVHVAARGITLISTKHAVPIVGPGYLQDLRLTAQEQPTAGRNTSQCGLEQSSCMSGVAPSDVIFSSAELAAMSAACGAPSDASDEVCCSAPASGIDVCAETLTDTEAARAA